MQFANFSYLCMEAESCLELYIGSGREGGGGGGGGGHQGHVPPLEEMLPPLQAIRCVDLCDRFCSE